MPVLRQVSRSEVTDEIVTAYYDRLFGDRDPVAEPGTATGTPGDWWTVFALAPDIFKHAVDGFAVSGDGPRRGTMVTLPHRLSKQFWKKCFRLTFLVDR